MASAPPIFDRALVAARLARRDPAEDFVTRLVLADLDERLLAVSRTFARAVIMAPDPRVLPAGGRTAGGAIEFERLGSVLAGPEGIVDPEALTLPRADYDLIVSILDLSLVHDVPGFLARVRAHLAPDGLFLGAVIGGSTLSELRRAFLAADAEVSGGAYARVAPFLHLSDAGPLLQRTGFALPVTDLESHTIRYASPLGLMQDLKRLGAANPLADRPGRLATPALVAAASSAYEEIAADPDGRVRATLQIVWFSGWAPHESQQKPLRPGSAQVSLAAVLGKKT